MIQFLRISLWFLILAFPPNILAIDCDCFVSVFSPLTGSLAETPHILEKYRLESFSRNTQRAQVLCRESCLEKFHQELPSERLDEILKDYSKDLIRKRVVGYNCTGPTTFKFPIRVKASLGKAGLGNVENFIQVTRIEKSCF